MYENDNSLYYHQRLTDVCVGNIIVHNYIYFLSALGQLFNRLQNEDFFITKHNFILTLSLLVKINFVIITVLFYQKLLINNVNIFEACRTLNINHKGWV